MTTVVNIPLDLIDTAPQVRTKFKDSTIAELAADIKAHGVLQPLVVQAKGARFMLLIGERRLRAIRYLGDTTAPAILATVSPELAEEVQLMENIQREDLSTGDLAAAVAHLLKKHGTVAEVARRCNKSASWVSKRLAIGLNVGTACAALLDAGVKDVELIYTFMKLEKINPKKAAELVPHIIAGTIGREDVKDWLIETDGAPALPSADSQQSDIEDAIKDEDAAAIETAKDKDYEILKADATLLLRYMTQIAELENQKAVYKTRDMMRALAVECLEVIGQRTD